MNNEHVVTDDCPATGCPSPNGFLRVETPPSVPLTEALIRWQKEARFGVCPTGRYRMPYFVWGSGPPIVFAHGLGDRARSFVPVMETLRHNFTCVAYELPAGGADGARLGAYRHRHLVADLFALLDHLGLARSYLYGSSFGSTITLAAMHAQPQRTPRAVLQGGFAQRPLARWESILCRFARYWPGTLSTMPLRSKLTYAVERRQFAHHPEMWAFMQSNNGSQMKAAMARRVLMILNIDLRRVLPQIRQPVLMLCGENDQIVPRACETALLQGLAHVQRVDFPSCGHFPQYTRAPLVAELVRRFLTAPSCGSY